MADGAKIQKQMEKLLEKRSSSVNEKTKHH